MKWLGCTSAINLDGGGSTTLWVNSYGDNGVVNHPSDNKKWDHEGAKKSGQHHLYQKQTLNLEFINHMSFKQLTFLLFISVAIYACTSNSNKAEKSNNAEEEGLTFRDVNGVRFYEVKRRFSNGLSFNKDGFMLASNMDYRV